MPILTRTSVLPCDPDTAWSWMQRPGAFERLTAPWDRIRPVEIPGRLVQGEQAVFDVRLGPIWKRWVAEHTEVSAPHRFADRQLRGPFQRMDHVREARAQGGRTRWQERIDWRLPLHPVSRLAAGRSVHRQLGAMLDHRARVLAHDLEELALVERHGSRRVLISGSTGLIGAQLAAFLSGQGHEVVRLVRPGSRLGVTPLPAIEWDPRARMLDPAALEGFDVVIHLAGAGIGDRRWTRRRRALLRSSRVDATRLLATALAGLKRPPDLFIGASAVGWYGETGEDEVDDRAAPGRGFLAELARAWERASEALDAVEVRRILLRTSVVLSASGGALPKMVRPTLLGAGGPIAGGRQFLPWITLDDALRAIHHLMLTPDTSGPCDLVAPGVVRQREFQRTLSRVLRRPALAPLPRVAVRLMFGEMGLALLTESHRQQPTRLLASGFTFRQPGLESALREVLGRTPAPARGGMAPAADHDATRGHR